MMRARPTLRPYTLAVAATLLLGCGRTKDESRAIEVWLTCDECINGERSAVRAIGPRAIPALEHALRNGPSAARRQLMQGKLQRAHASFSTGPSDAYVQQLMGNYVATFQKRAALSLGDLGTDRARRALDDVLAQPTLGQYRPDVIRLVRFVRAASGATTYEGTVSPALVGVGDTVRIDSAPGLAFTGDERAALDDAPFPPADVHLSVEPHQLRFLAAGPVGPHAVAISNVGATTDTQVAHLVIATPMDANDRATAACATLPCLIASAPMIRAGGMPLRAILTLRGPGASPDTVDVFRIENPSGVAPLPVTARLRWPTSQRANLDLRWLPCAPPYAPVGNSDGATTANPEVTSVSIPEGACRVLTVLAPSAGIAPVFARVEVTTP